MKVKVVSASRFAELVASGNEKIEYSKGQAFLYFGDLLVISESANVMSNEQLHNIRMNVIKAAGNAETVAAAMEITVNSKNLNAYPIQITGVGSYGVDCLNARVRINLFQCIPTSEFIHGATGQYRSVNMQVQVPRYITGIDGKKYEAAAYTEIDAWFQNAKNAGFTETNGQVVVATYDPETKKYTFSGHSNLFVQFEHMSWFSFELALNEDGGLIEVDNNIEGSRVKGFKTLLHDSAGDFAVLPVAGGSIPTPKGMSPEMKALSDELDSIGVAPKAPSVAPTPAGVSSATPVTKRMQFTPAPIEKQ